MTKWNTHSFFCCLLADPHMQASMHSE